MHISMCRVFGVSERVGRWPKLLDLMSSVVIAEISVYICIYKYIKQKDQYRSVRVQYT